MSTELSYEEFLKRKKETIKNYGIIIENAHNSLFQFQKHIVKLALSKGRYAVFGGTGTGKTLIQLEIARQLKLHNINSIIITPLAVSLQTINEAKKFLNFDVVKYNGSDNVQITNYEQIDNIDFSLFDCIILDESGILKNYEGKIKNKLLDVAKNINYRYAFTATPSPNDVTEITNHAEFLGIATRLELLSKYFIHDSGDTKMWRLKHHAKERFYEYLSSWSIMFNNPNDLGFNDISYELPSLNIKEIKLQTENKGDSLFNDISINAIDFNRELKRSMELRLNKVIDIANNSNENFIVWIKLNDEEKYLKGKLKDARFVNGSDTVESKENNLIGFANNEFRVLVTKPKIAQFGLNYQNCNNQIFASLDFSFESFYQSIRRSYRFGQKKEVNIHCITLDTMQNVINTIKEKELQFKELQNFITKYHKVK